MRVLAVGSILVLPALTAVGVFRFVRPRSRIVASGFFAGLAVITFGLVVHALSRDIAQDTTRDLAGFLWLIPWWPIQLLIHFVPWLVVLTPALLLRRRESARASRAALGVAVLLYAGWLSIFIVYPFYELTGVCLPPAHHVVATGGGTDESCELPPG